MEFLAISFFIVSSEKASETETNAIYRLSISFQYSRDMKVQSCQNQGKRRKKKTVDLAKIMTSRV